MKQYFTVLFFFTLLSFTSLYASAFFENDPISIEVNSEHEVSGKVGETIRIAFKRASGYRWFAINVSISPPAQEDYSVDRFEVNEIPPAFDIEDLKVDHPTYIEELDDESSDYDIGTIVLKKKGEYYILYAAFKTYEPSEVRDAVFATIKLIVV